MIKNILLISIMGLVLLSSCTQTVSKTSSDTVTWADNFQDIIKALDYDSYSDNNTSYVKSHFGAIEGVDASYQPESLKVTHIVIAVSSSDGKVILREYCITNNMKDAVDFLYGVGRW